MLTLGVIADTHVPDKTRCLNPQILEIFQDAKVSAVLHAGDISTPGVLTMLEEIAPVHAVKGNRDWVCLNYLPRERTLTFGGLIVGLVHGHGSVRGYLVSKMRYLLHGYRLDDFLPHFLDHFPDVDVLVFGHTHRPVSQLRGRRLLFNPGSACCFEEGKLYRPGIGLLQISDGHVQGKIVSLDC